MQQLCIFAGGHGGGVTDTRKHGETPRVHARPASTRVPRVCSLRALSVSVPCLRARGTRARHRAYRHAHRGRTAAIICAQQIHNTTIHTHVGRGRDPGRTLAARLAGWLPDCSPAYLPARSPACQPLPLSVNPCLVSSSSFPSCFIAFRLSRLPLRPPSLVFLPPIPPPPLPSGRSIAYLRAPAENRRARGIAPLPDPGHLRIREDADGKTERRHLFSRATGGAPVTG